MRDEAALAEESRFSYDSYTTCRRTGAACRSHVFAKKVWRHFIDRISTVFIFKGAENGCNAVKHVVRNADAICGTSCALDYNASSVKFVLITSWVSDFVSAKRYRNLPCRFQSVFNCSCSSFLILRHSHLLLTQQLLYPAGVFWPHGWDDSICGPVLEEKRLLNQGGLNC